MTALTMVTRSQQFYPDDKENQDSDASSSVSEIFSGGESDSDSNSDLGYDSQDSDDGDDVPDDSSDDGQLPPEYYLAQAESLDVSQLRQKRYSDSTQERLDETRMYWNRYCQHIGANAVQQWKNVSDSDETVRFLYAFFVWRCDIRRGKNGRHCPGIQYKSSLESFWKWWHLVLKQETASELNKETIVKVQDVIAIIAEEKGLRLDRRPKKNMYIEDVAEFARVLLTTTEMTFDCGWQRIQLLFYCQLAAITASRPGALLHLCYRDIGLTLIRDPEGGRPRLFIFLKPDFTKKFLGKKAANEFKIPEIIFDPTLVLSPHVCLLSMLFHIKGFKTVSTTGPVLDCAEKLYSLEVLDGKGQQELKLKDEILDKFVFCQVERQPTGYRIALEKRLTESTLRSRMRRAGEIIGFDQVTRPYLLRYAGAKEFNNSEEVTDALQNVILQHSDIRTFVRHYEVDVDVDVQGIIRKTGSQTPLVRFACSLSASIDPDRPYKLSHEESKSLNELPVVRARQDTVNKRKRKWEDHKAKLDRAMAGCQAALGHLAEGELFEVHRQLRDKLERFQDRTMEAKRRYNKAVRELRNEKQRQRNRRTRLNLEKYRNEQPVIDLERQLAGKLVDTKVMGALEHKASLSSQHLMVVDTILTMPGATLEAEYQRRIDAINAMTAFCSAEEGRPTPRATQSRRLSASDDDESCRPAKRQRHSAMDDTEIVLYQAMESVRVRSTNEQLEGLERPKAKRPTKCFLCIGNPDLPLKDRVKDYATPGSLTRHFRRKHVNPPWPVKGVECNVCGSELLQQKIDLVNHAEAAHGTVVRGRAQEGLALEYLHKTGLASDGS
ncbi:hypothetical protein Asppvi_008460 [Aspergillus pseudoviridinutans]|uniref:C2H2-type domain-containing protein n=1 Tax=Aspergillus pseudoviridinutans TaxID=1517512 RepID=A0A9P3BIA6_9EURO|nr:uncharacterized protein Asppvi_008460 [Aspergillus pseudoviridinutans]GIJ89518.1 hypothetical protein Asppvi_008460 [Aspergillus pseudoviridinutans]